MELLNVLVLVLMVLVSVAFFTLLERKVLGYMQIRKGPNKVGVVGILQPFADALKLFSKEQLILEVSNLLIYYFCPILGLILSLCMWLVYPIEGLMVDFDYSVLLFLIVSGLGVYSVMGSGWSSNSKYALLGSYRSVAQTISYEVSMALLIIVLILIVGNYDFYGFLIYQFDSTLLFFGLIPLGLVWIGICLAECNRAPFDFAEGESELVSGFNVEYSGGGFSLIFLAEYASILGMSMITNVMFFGGKLMGVGIFLISFLYLWVRASFPRYRYDKLMNLAWSIYLPLTLFYFLIVFGIMLFLFEMG
uniref:NADH-ubiquinone oxidoreductase chain 1 n=1 Tax=Nothopuga sp. 1 LP-2008 TaxID=504482 RepID=A9LI73_9ARAC|nr:NADH dehydrogenase subunit 1 [Nothopuga sp. 1 LP-2008]ABS71901.1 NADH dehydrogenase subunit 1 [Nothopuga sp. 1 LP-2008]